MSPEEPAPAPPGPVSAVGVVASLGQVPAGYDVVTQTTDGADADLWKDALFKSKVTRFLCFTRNPGPDVVADLKVIDAKEPAPEGFAPVVHTLDTKETATRKKKLCVKTLPRSAAQTAVWDLQVLAKSKYHLLHYRFVGEINNLGLWYRLGDVPRQPPALEAAAVTDGTSRRRGGGRPHYEQQSSGGGGGAGGGYTPTVVMDVPFDLSAKFTITSDQVQWGGSPEVRIKSQAQIEEEFHYNFSTERSIAP